MSLFVGGHHKNNAVITNVTTMMISKALAASLIYHPNGSTSTGLAGDHPSIV